MSPMLAALRRCRALAFLLLAFSPGAMGVVLPVLHPCPVDTPTMAVAAAVGAVHAGHAAAAAHGSHAAHGVALGTPERGAPAHPAHGQTCHCPGTCCMSAVVSPTGFALATLRLRATLQPQAAPTDRWLPTPPTHLRPFATAPPASV
jgi:hypothetical protein